MEQFADLNIISPTAGNEQKYYDVCLELGYHTIAFNNIVNMKEAFVKNVLTLPSLKHQSSCHGLQVLNRVTLICSNPSHLRALKSPVLQDFDIVAVSMETEELLSKAIQDFSNCFQIISFNLTSPLSYRLKHSHLQPCKLNSIVFEICYSPAIKDSTACRHIVSNSKDLNWTSRGKGFIISSGADNPMFIRGPYDVINLVSLFGIDFKSAKQAISETYNMVLTKGFSRSQTFNGILQKIKISEFENNDNLSCPKKLLVSEPSNSLSLSKRAKH